MDTHLYTLSYSQSSETSTHTHTRTHTPRTHTHMYQTHTCTHRVEDMMKRSYAEDSTTRHEVDRKQALQQLEEDFRSLQDLDCSMCDEDLDHYYSACAHILHLHTQMQVHNCPLSCMLPESECIVIVHFYFRIYTTTQRASCLLIQMP